MGGPTNQNGNPPAPFSPLHHFLAFSPRGRRRRKAVGAISNIETPAWLLCADRWGVLRCRRDGGRSGGARWGRRQERHHVNALGGLQADRGRRVGKGDEKDQKASGERWQDEGNGLSAK